MRAARAALVSVALAACDQPAAADADTTTDADRGLVARLEMAGHHALARTRAGLEPDAFTTDGCSGGMSSAWQLAAGLFSGFADIHGAVPPWQACCVAHDRAYHTAGPDPNPQASFAARLAADERLRRCVRESVEGRRADLAAAYDVAEEAVEAGIDLIAEAMFTAVRTGGAPCSGLGWRWGYGYPHCIVGPADFPSDGASETAPD